MSWTVGRFGVTIKKYSWQAPPSIEESAATRIQRRWRGFGRALKIVKFFPEVRTWYLGCIRCTWFSREDDVMYFHVYYPADEETEDICINDMLFDRDILIMNKEKYI